MIFFVAGVHGVGKTSLCQKLAADMSIATVSAGDLIRQQMAGATWGVNKNTAQVNSNQEMLINAIQKFRKGHEDFILDGHFSLLDATGGIINIDINIFINLNFAGVIFIEDNADAIASRLEVRDGQSWNKQLITNLQRAEKNGALDFYKKTKVPTLVSRPNSYERMLDFFLTIRREHTHQDLGIE